MNIAGSEPPSVRSGNIKRCLDLAQHDKIWQDRVGKLQLRGLSTGRTHLVVIPTEVEESLTLFHFSSARLRTIERCFDPFDFSQAVGRALPPASSLKCVLRRRIGQELELIRFARSRAKMHRFTFYLSTIRREGTPI